MKFFQNIFILLSSVATVLTVCQTANAGNAGLNVGSGRITPGLEKQYLQYQLQNNGNSLGQIRVIPNSCICIVEFSPPCSSTIINNPWDGREEINVLPTVEQVETLFGNVSDISTVLLGGEDFTRVGEILTEETFIVQGGSEQGETLFGSVSDTSTVLLGGENFTGVGEILPEETFIVQGGSFPTATLFLPLLALLFFLGGDSGSSNIVTGDTAFTPPSTNESNSTDNEQNTIVDVYEPSVTNAIVLLTLILCLLRYRKRCSKGQVMGDR